MTRTTIDTIGRGHFGRVDLVWDDLTDRYLAIKFLPLPQPGVAGYQEARLMAASKHRNVVEIYHAEVVDSELQLVMEYMPNGSVIDHFKGRAAPVSDAIRMICDAARGIQHLHAAGVIHRDVRLANLLLTQDLEVKVSDFGLAGQLHEAKTAPTLGYHLTWPPENVLELRPIDSTAGDVYALSFAAYRLINGDDTLFSEVPSDLSAAIAKGKFPNRKAWLPHVHSGLRRAVVKGLHPDPSKRHQSAEAMRHALERQIPAVSWRPRIDAGTMVWEASDGNKSLTARLQPMGGRVFEFTVESATAGRVRNLRSQAARGSLGEVVTHSQEVLERLALRGS